MKRNQRKEQRRQNRSQEKEQKLKRRSSRNKIILALVIVLFAGTVTSLAIFSYLGSRLPYFEYVEGGNLLDRANDRLYIFSGSYLRASTIGAPVARYNDYGTMRRLHAIPGVDPEKWLSENIAEMGMPLLFRESSVPEPQLETFGTERVHIVEAGERMMRIGLLLYGAVIQELVDDFVGGEAVSRPFSVARDYLLFFESPLYPGIYFVIEHLTCFGGNAYLSKRWPPSRTVRTGVCLLGGDEE